MTDKRDKTGGRKAGTPNKATALIRQRIDEADPIGFMIQVATGETVDGSTPTMAERLNCLLYTSPSPRDKRQSRMPSSA